MTQTAAAGEICEEREVGIHAGSKRMPCPRGSWPPCLKQRKGGLSRRKKASPNRALSVS